MDAQQEHDEPQRREGFGGRVRRFIDTELSRAVDKDEPTHDAAATPAAHAAPATARLRRRRHPQPRHAEPIRLRPTAVRSA